MGSHVFVFGRRQRRRLVAPFLGLMLLDHVRIAEVGWRQSQGIKPFL